SAWSLVARQEARKPHRARGCLGESERLCCKRGLTPHNILARDNAERSIATWRNHESEEDRDAQDRAGRPSAVATRRPAQTTRRAEWPKDRAARRNELRRADRVSPEAPEHAP